ncbi:MAG: hypothetical protein GY851_22400 [bacterium]|nr:hypothetical protein [bacterium]
MTHDNQTDYESPDDRAVDLVLADAFNGDPPPEVEAAAEGHYRLAEAALAGRQGRAAHRPLRGVLAAAGLVLAAALAWIAAGALWQPSATWAQVVDSFDGVPHFAATVFVNDNAGEPPERIDVWVGTGGRVRVHNRKAVLFGSSDGEVRLFRVDSGQGYSLEELDSRTLREAGLTKPVGILRLMASVDRLSLDKLLSHFGDHEVLPSPTLNADASVSQDLWVFDVQTNQAPSWLRVWALRNTHLPVRMRMWDPRDGDATEILFEYAEPQPDEAFSPEAYAEALVNESGTVNRLYALMRDPAERQVTPKDLHSTDGFHMPDVVQAGRTAEGVFWVESRNAANRTPEGRSFYGFGKLTDNLGQEYIHQWLGHRVQDDVVVEYFVPLNYRLGYAKPASYTLTCWSQPDHYKQPAHTVGSVELSQWLDDMPVPDRFDNAPAGNRFIQFVVGEWERRHNWDQFDRLLATIPGEPESDSMALYRESKRLTKLARMGREDEAFALSSRLTPVIVAEANGVPWGHERVIKTHVIQLVKRDRTDEAVALLKPYRAELRTVDTSDRACFFVADLIWDLQRAGTSPDTIGQVFGFDVLDLPEVAERLAERGNNGFTAAEDNPRYKPWLDYVDELGRHYESNPLPEAMAFVSDEMPFPADSPAYAMGLPGHPGYTVTRLAPDWATAVRTLAWSTNRDADRIQIDESLSESAVNAVVVFNKKTVTTEDVIHRLSDRMGVTIREGHVRRTVWVARYDGRKLPNWRDVRPPDLGDDAVQRGGGTSTTTRSLLKTFERSLNEGVPAEEQTVILDETGLPSELGENQTMGSICLSYSYAFGSTTESVAIVKDWFRDEFGITFDEEERDVTVLEAVPAAS